MILSSWLPSFTILVAINKDLMQRKLDNIQLLKVTNRAGQGALMARAACQDNVHIL